MHREHDRRMAVAVDLQVDGPRPPARVVGEHLGEVLGRRGGVVEDVGVDGGAVGSPQPTTVDDTVVDAVGVVVGVLLGRDEVDGAGAIGGVADVWPPRTVEQPTACLPRRAVVAGHEDVGVAPGAAHEGVDVTAVGRGVDVGVRGHRPVVEPALGLPRRRVAGAARDAPPAEVVGGVHRVHRHVPAVRSDVQGGRVVVVGLQVAVQHRPSRRTGRHVVRDDLDVALTGRAIGPAGAGDGAHQQEAAWPVDDGALVLEPRPGAVVVEDDDRFRCRRSRAERAGRCAGPAAGRHRREGERAEATDGRGGHRWLRWPAARAVAPRRPAGVGRSSGRAPTTPGRSPGHRDGWVRRGRRLSAAASFRLRTVRRRCAAGGRPAGSPTNDLPHRTHLPDDVSGSP